MRRNVFWLAYATDRSASVGNGWAHAIDDADVAQLLPVRGDHFEHGVSSICSCLCRERERERDLTIIVVIGSCCTP